MKPACLFFLLLVLCLSCLTGCACFRHPDETSFRVPDLEPVRSSHFAAARYDEEALELKFRDGAVQRFEGIPEPLARDFFHSAGKYGFFRKNIKPRYERIVLAKSYRNRESAREIVHLRTNWLVGTQEIGRTTVVAE